MRTVGTGGYHRWHQLGGCGGCRFLWRGPALRILAAPSDDRSPRARLLSIRVEICGDVLGAVADSLTDANVREADSSSPIDRDRIFGEAEVIGDLSRSEQLV